MFPNNNFAPSSQPWVRSVQDTVEAQEKQLGRQQAELKRLHEEGLSVLGDVSANVNDYYQNTRELYPVRSLFVPMSAVLGGDSKVVSMSAPASAGPTVAENWISLWSYSFSLPFATTQAMVRLNSAEFTVVDSSSFGIAFRWVVNSAIEGINTIKWMSRHESNLTWYNMDSGGGRVINITNRNTYLSGPATSTLTAQLQARIVNVGSPNSSVSARNVTFLANDNGVPTYLDLMVTT